MLEVVKTLLLNNTQRELAIQFSEDRISPCLLNILDSAKNSSTQVILMQIILLSRQGRNKCESDVFFDKISTNNPKKAMTLLQNLFALYQEGNETHIFMKSILDKRFYVDSKGGDFNSWKNGCKEELLSIYTCKIDAALMEKYPDVYQEALKKVFRDSTVLDQEPSSYNP